MKTIQAEGPSRNRFPGTRLLALLCALLLAAGVLPLYAISFDNHPYYDDFGFSGGAHAVWQASHSLTAVLNAALTGSQAKRVEWQGTYTGTFLSNLQPAVFSESLYWLTTALLLTAFSVLPRRAVKLWLSSNRPASTSSRLVPLAPAAGSVLATTMTKSACQPLVIKVLLPFNT